MAGETEAAEALVIKMIGDATQFIGQLNAVTQNIVKQAAEVQKHSDAVQHHSEEVNHSVEMLNERTIAAGEIIAHTVEHLAEKFKELGKEALNAAANEETAMFRLGATLRANGLDVEKLTERYEEFAREMEDTTTLSREAVIRMAASATRFGVTNPANVEHVIRQAQGLAAQGLGDPEHFVRMLAMAQQGGVSGFGARRLLMLMPQSVRNIKDDQERSVAMQKELDKYIAEAANETKTWAGMMKQVHNLVEHVWASFGKPVMEFLKPYIDDLKEFLHWVEDLDEKYKEFIAKIGISVASVAGAIGGWMIFGGVIKDVFSVFTGLTSLLFSWPALVVGGIGALAYKFMDVEATWDGITSAIMDAWTALTDYFGPAAEGIVSALQAGDLEMAWQIFSASARAAFTDIVNFIDANWDPVMEWISDSWETVLYDVGRLFGSFFSGVVEQAGWALGLVGDLFSTFFDWAWEQMVDLWDGIPEGALTEFLVKATIAIVDWSGKIIPIVKAALTGSEWGFKMGNQLIKGIQDADLKKEIEDELAAEFDDIGEEASLGERLSASVSKSLENKPAFDPFAGFEYSDRNPFPRIITDLSKYKNEAQKELEGLLDENEQKRLDEQWIDWFNSYKDEAGDAGAGAGDNLSKEFAKHLRFDAALSNSQEAAHRIWEYMTFGAIGEGGGGKGKGGAQAFNAADANSPEGDARMEELAQTGNEIAGRQETLLATIANKPTIQFVEMGFG